MYEFWRFVFVQQEVGKLAMTAIEYPPMQKGASFNLDAVKAQIEDAMRNQAGQVSEDVSIVKRAGRLPRGGPRLHQRSKRTKTINSQETKP